MLVISDALWGAMLDSLEQHPPDVERVAFLDGFIVGDAAVVTTVTLPDAECYPTHYTVPASAMSQAGAHLRQFGMQRLAQVHTHGNEWVHHSSRDDEMAYSQMPGAVSIVLPYHAHLRPTPFQGLIHLRTPGGWRTLNPAEAQTTIKMVPSSLDFRRFR